MLLYKVVCEIYVKIHIISINSSISLDTYKLVHESTLGTVSCPNYTSFLQWRLYRLPLEIYNSEGAITDASDFIIFIIPNGRKWRGTKMPLDESESGEWKSWLKAQHSGNYDHGIWSHHFMANRWGNSGNSRDLFSWAPKSLQMVKDREASHAAVHGVTKSRIKLWATEQHVNCPSKLQAQRPVVQCHKDSRSTPIFYHLLTEWLEHCLCGALSGVWLFSPEDSSLPDSSVHGILQAGMVEGVAIFPTQRPNSCLLCFLHWQSDSFPQSHLGSLAGALV